MDLGLKDKRAVVTGASKGIGRSIALRLAEEGAAVAICARGEAALRETERELRGRGGRAFAETCDVASSAELDRFLETIQDSDLDREQFYRTLGGSEDTRPLWQLMLHVVNHGTQHRAEAAAMLTEYGHSPGDIDFTIYLRHRATDKTADRERRNG